LNRFELRAPYDGLVVERNLSIGESVKEDAPIFTISDLSTVWAEVHIPAKDLPHVRVGGQLTVRATAFEAKAMGTVAFVGALVGEQTRMAKARILLANPKGAWRPGLFVTAEVNASEVQVPVAVDSEAIQTLGTQPVVFIRNENSFVPRAVKLGMTDGRSIEVIEGLPPGTRYAGKGSYILKSELSKLASEDGY
jgi:cobalt-zinc-cadmium efflux system membrane fusion protein